MRIFVNGRAADDTLFAPGWTSYHTRLQYQTYDVTDLLEGGGENALGIVLGNGWYRGKLTNKNKRFYGDRRAVLLQLHVTYEDGSMRRMR